MSDHEDEHFEKAESGASDTYPMAVGSIKKGKINKFTKQNKSHSQNTIYHKEQKSNFDF